MDYQAKDKQQEVPYYIWKKFYLISMKSAINVG